MLNINEYKYPLPQERIAVHPLSQRDNSKLLVYQKGKITDQPFKSIVEFLPQNAFLFFNNTKVIPARLHFIKETGAEIEIFLLSPMTPSQVLSETMATSETCSWRCTIGNLKRWPEGTVLKKTIDKTILEAHLIDRENGHVEFQWDDQRSFAQIINDSGETPLPPYLKRKAEPSDKERYQTIYSNQEGAVAAPTAGLHFTDEVFRSLSKRNIAHDFLTLHVSAGTFQPVKTEDANEHLMHNEQIVITRKNLEHLLIGDTFIIPVGTTSMRTLESIYWFGAKLLKNKNANFTIGQNDPYVGTDFPEPKKAIEAVLKYLDDKDDKETLLGHTSIFIKPGYQFKICKGLITNFHQPASTLILLVAAFVGDDWKRIYEHALANDYRFLSFGDSSLLLP
jgi:S-adenosylmethionine:tRNA ribosyltransferase-isomerase